jgi:hypothetical protein
MKLNYESMNFEPRITQIEMINTDTANQRFEGE